MTTCKHSNCDQQVWTEPDKSKESVGFMMHKSVTKTPTYFYPGKPIPSGLCFFHDRQARQKAWDKQKEDERNEKLVKEG